MVAPKEGDKVLIEIDNGLLECKVLRVVPVEGNVRIDNLELSMSGSKDGLPDIWVVQD